MKTDELIDLLAKGAQPVPARSALRRMTWALAFGLPISAAIVAFDYGIRRDLAQVVLLPMFWVKLLVPAVLAIAGFMACERLGRPGVQLRGLRYAFVLPVAALWLLAGIVLLNAPTPERLPLVLGQTWRSCVLNIFFIAIPIFVAALLAQRSLAPTRPACAGAAAGTLAGGAAAAVYALHCPELQAPFLAVWYVAGIALTALVGALMGKFALKW
jgi:hypothetical protein